MFDSADTKPADTEDQQYLMLLSFLYFSLEHMSAQNNDHFSQFRHGLVVKFT